jgi:predicted transposase/invertase (TIGR01784 family)
MTLDYTWERREELIRREEREEGRALGRKEGREEGHREEARQIIKNMLKNNFSLEIISECTNQPLDYISQIARELGTTEAFVQEETRYGK